MTTCDREEEAPLLVRSPADRRTLLWTLVFVPTLLVGHFLVPEGRAWLLPLSMYFAVSCAVIAHNHMHCPTFKRGTLNRAYSHFISVFYGYPVFVWAPTHNLNHHRYVNKHGDATITWRYTNRHNVVVAATYFFVSAFHQGRWIGAFLRQARASKPALYRRLIGQYFVTYGAHLAVLSIAIGLFGLGEGVATYLYGLGIPAFFALWTVMLFNYCQHVHTDPWSKRNHSRNFTGRLLNFLLFGNGYHTVHHDQANLHWSEAAAAHARIAHEIDPRLCHRSMWLFFIRQYALAPFFPRLGTEQVGRAPFDCPVEQRERDAPGQYDLGRAFGGQV
jgi:fatty acid desaturase